MVNKDLRQFKNNAHLLRMLRARVKYVERRNNQVSRLHQNECNTFSKPPSILLATSYSVIRAMGTKGGLKCFFTSVASKLCSSAANSTFVGLAPTIQKFHRYLRCTSDRTGWLTSSNPKVVCQVYRCDRKDNRKHSNILDRIGGKCSFLRLLSKWQPLSTREAASQFGKVQ